MALSPIKPRDNSFQELDRFYNDCKNEKCEHKYDEILKEHPKHQSEPIVVQTQNEEPSAKRGRPAKA